MHLHPSICNPQLSSLEGVTYDTLWDGRTCFTQHYVLICLEDGRRLGLMVESNSPCRRSGRAQASGLTAIKSVDSLVTTATLSLKLGMPRSFGS